MKWIGVALAVLIAGLLLVNLIGCQSDAPGATNSLGAIQR